MTYADWAEAFSIFAKYATDKNHNEIAAEHDVIYAGENTTLFSMKDFIRLQELGWNYNAGLESWSHYV